MKKLGDAELEIMLIIWAAGKPVKSTYIQENLRGRLNWGLSSIMTSLSRLVEKGFLICEKREGYNYYSAIVTEDEYKAFEGKSLLGKLYGNSLRNLTAALVSGGTVSREDLRELRTYLDELEGK